MCENDGTSSRRARGALRWAGQAAVTATVMVAWATACAWACGWSYRPDCDLGHDVQMARSPQASFRLELRRAMLRTEWAPMLRKLAKDGPPPSSTAEAGLADVTDSMKDAPPRVRQRVLEGYRAIRSMSAEVPIVPLSRGEKSPVGPVAGRVPEGLDREFEVYLLGARAWYWGNLDEARTHWQALLDLPADRRRYRTVWAAYMLGRSYMKDDTGKARAWFAKTAKLAGKGFVDTPDLVGAAAGWLGALELADGNVLGAMRHYARQHAGGADSAAVSLRICAGKVLAGDLALRARAARDPVARAVMGAHFVAGRHPSWASSWPSTDKELRAWLEGVEEAGVEDVDHAAYLAWGAYRNGMMDVAERWVRRAPKSDRIACWVRGKLAMRAGKLDEAASHVAKALRAVEDVPDKARTWDDWRQRHALSNELAALQLSGRQYVEALELLIRFEHMGHAAYVAERILTLEELKRYVDKGAGECTAQQRGRLAHLLAKRLSRAGRTDEAMGYYPPDEAKRMRQYVVALAVARDANRPVGQRAEAWWAAALVLRRDGQGLIGYDTGWYGKKPDGTFRDWLIATRVRAADEYDLAPVSDDEVARAKRHRPDPMDRWHYGHLAVEHAWRACERMPDEDERTAWRLCEAGTWIKYRDPDAADRFYKALVKRCGTTELGRKAAERRWFPDIDAMSIK